ncbi:hypothetical protein AZZ89_004959, partial [Enterobacter hormaechei]
RLKVFTEAVTHFSENLTKFLTQHLYQG